MGRYRAYSTIKSSEAAWLGDVPEHWDVFSAKRVFKQRREAAGPEDPQLAASQKYGVLPQEVLMELTGNKVALALSGTSSFRRVAENDFVISLRSFEGGIEYSAYAGCVSPAYTVLEPMNGAAPPFYRYLLKSNPFVRALQASTDSLRDGKAISYDSFGGLALPVPTREEQSQIAAFLDHETAKIDRLIEKQEKLIELLKEKRQAVISHAVTKGLDPNTPKKDSGVEWLGEIPAHWGIKQVRYATKLFRGKFGHRPRNDPRLYEGRHPFIQTGDVAQAKKYIVSYKQTLNDLGASVSQKFPKGTLVMAIAANVGDVAILNYDAYCPDSVVGFKPEKCSVEYLRYALIAARDGLLRTATQNAQMNLNIDRISCVKISIPPPKEQQCIVNSLDAMLSKFRQVVERVEHGLSLLHERRTALISAAVTGKIDVRDWKPNGNAQTTAA